jgi:hypothetical protein
MCAVWYIMQDIWTGVLCHLWLLEHSHQHKLWRVI